MVRNFFQKSVQVVEEKKDLCYNIFCVSLCVFDTQKLGDEIGLSKIIEMLIFSVCLSNLRSGVNL